MEQNNLPTIAPVSNGPTLAELQAAPLPESFYTLTGPLQYVMTNDALFHIVLQTNPKVLKALICSLLDKAPKEIKSIEVTNPIILGGTVYSKDFVLDTKILLNDDTLINTEMQVLKLKFWKERSLGYLSRTFDNLNKGENYVATKPAIHIGILDFDLFPNDTEFYATYHMANDISHQIYSDKFRLSVLQLRQMEHATEADRQQGRYLWAKFFKATTWEEIRMLAEQNPIFAEAAETIYRVTADQRVRDLCEGRREGEKTHNTLVILRDQAIQELKDAQGKLQDTKEELQDAKVELQDTKEELQDTKEELQDTKEELQDTKEELQDTKEELQDAKVELMNVQKQLADKDTTIATFLDKEVQQITKKIQAGKSLEQTAAELEETPEVIKELYDRILGEMKNQ